MGTFESQNTTEYTPVSQDIGEYFLWDEVAEAFDMGSEPQKRERILENIQEYFGEDFDTLNITEGVSRDRENNLICIPVGDTKYYFDIYSEMFAGTTIDQALNYVSDNPPEELVMISEGVDILFQLLKTNSESGWMNSYIEENDIVDEGLHEVFSGMNAKELQMTIRSYIQVFEQRGGFLALNSSQREEMSELITSYCEMVMGIGETYEEAVGEFYKTEAEINNYIHVIIYSQNDFESCMDYYKDVQERIYSNTRTSSKNKEAQQIYSQRLAAKIFERFQREYTLEEDADKKQQLIGQGVYFAQVITERVIDINNELRNPALAEEICIFILSTEGGIFDSLNHCTRYSLDFVDEKLGNRSPSQIVTTTQDKLEEIGISPADVFLNQSMGISLVSVLGVDDIGGDYNSLSLIHKREISILVRFLEKLESDEYSLGNLQELSPDELHQKVMESSSEIYHEAIDAVTEAYDKNFDTSYQGWLPTVDIMTHNLREIGLGESQIEAFTLFNDIRGNDGGASHDYSDANLTLAGNIGRSVGIIAANIIIVMAATALTGGVAIPAFIPSLLASGGGLTTAGSLLSIGVGASVGTAANFGILDPRRHDTKGEMYSDLASDFAINTFHAVYMERLTMRLWGNLSMRGKVGLIAGDFGSGIAIEVARDMYVRSIYQTNPVLQNHRSEDFSEYFHFLDERFLSEIPDEVRHRFLQARNIFHAWNFGELIVYEEDEFQDIDFENINDLSNAIIAWCERIEEKSL